MTQVSETIDETVREIYSEQVTVNLNTESTMTPDEFWSSMQIIAINNKSLINFRIK